MIYDRTKLPQILAPLLDEWDRTVIDNNQFLSYILATTKHETGGKMIPVSEIGSDAYLSKYYTNPTLRKNLGNLSLADASLFKGRGYVQITGRGNYKRIGGLIGQPLEQTPDLALQPDIASKIAVDGMLHGWFTGKSLNTYFANGNLDTYNARRIINGLDQASKIQGYYTYYSNLLKAVS